MESTPVPTGSRQRLPRRVWRSVFRGPLVPRDDSDRKRIVFDHLVLHPRPIRVPAVTIGYWHTYGLGGMALVLFLLLAATGMLQALSIAWDTERERRFFLYPGRDIPPDDWLHWTRAAAAERLLAADPSSPDARRLEAFIELGAGRKPDHP